MDGQPVTVTKAAGVPAGVTITPQSLARPVTVTVKPLTNAEAAEAAGSGYSLGPAESRVALDVSVSPALAASARLCLPVDRDLREAAAGRELSLLRGGEPVDGSMEEPPDGPVIEVCADVPSFSPFAVGYPDSKPELHGRVPDADLHGGRGAVGDPAGGGWRGRGDLPADAGGSSRRACRWTWTRASCRGRRPRR